MLGGMMGPIVAEAAVLAMAALVMVYGGWDYPDSFLRVLQYMLFAALLALPAREPTPKP